MVVTDKSGHYITGLKAADFQVFEDGAPEPIVAFSTTTDSADADPPSHPLNGSSIQMPRPARKLETPRRTYLICIDVLHSSFANFNSVRTALTKFFQLENSPDSQYALMALGWKTRVVVDSTRDASTILDAIQSKALLKTIQDSEASNSAASALQFTALMGEYCGSCACRNRSSDGPECDFNKGRVRGFLLRSSERAFLLDQSFLRQLRQLVEAIAGMPTTHTVIFVSDGFNRFPGRELYQIMQGFEPRDRSLMSNSRDNQSQLDSVLKLASAKDVKFYTIDSRGVYTSSQLAGSSFDASNPGTTRMGATPEGVDLAMDSVGLENADVMAELAHTTGGLFFQGSNDLLKGIRKAFADGREYYVLAYIPTNKTLDGKFRKITVEVKGRKLLVNAKSGYWATE